MGNTADPFELTEEAIQLEDFAKAIMAFVRDRAVNGGISLYCNVDPGLPLLRADLRFTKQILLNLISNAIKFTPPGGRVEVQMYLIDGHIALSVSDTGIGIAEDRLRAIKESSIFSAVRGAHKPLALGLRVVRGLAELHGASLELKSQVGAGTTATVIFPAERTMVSTSTPGLP
jgi:signal transduction histidine kinase